MKKNSRVTYIKCGAVSALALAFEDAYDRCAGSRGKYVYYLVNCFNGVLKDGDPYVLGYYGGDDGSKLTIVLSDGLVVCHIGEEWEEYPTAEGMAQRSWHVFSFDGDKSGVCDRLTGVHGYRYYPDLLCGRFTSCGEPVGSYNTIHAMSETREEVGKIKAPTLGAFERLGLDTRYLLKYGRDD